jgi:membrane protease YdiL (CAAX protease family)
MILFTIGGFGPTIAALFCLDHKISVKGILKFVFSGSKESALILLLFIILETITFGLSSMEFNPVISLPIVPLVVLQAVFIYGGNEELGWRGIMQPILQNKLPYPIATIIVGAVWAIWHLPLWFIEGNSHQGSSFVMFAIFAVLLSYWLSAIINSHGSVFYCMIMHGITNTLLSVFVIKVNWILLVGLLVLTALANIISIKKQKLDPNRRAYE